MTYASYLARKCGRCESQQGKEIKGMKITLTNGLVVEGTLEQVQQVAKTFGEVVPFHGDGIHYNSSTHGLLRIRDMDTRHVRNATLKLYREWVNNLSTLTDRDLVLALRNGPTDKTLVGLIVELQRRFITGR